MNTEYLLENLDIVTAQVNKTSGRKKLRVEDFKIAVRDDLPPEDLASLGAKKVLAPKILQPPQRFEARIRRRIAEVGFPFLNSFAVAKTETARLAADLQKICDEAIQWRDIDLPKIFIEAQEEWLGKNIEWEAALRAAAPSLEEVQKSLHFNFSVYKVKADEQTPGHLTDEVADLGTKLLEAVSDDVNEYYVRNIQKNPGASLGVTGVASLLRRIRRKLNSLAFLEGSAGPMVQAIDNLLLALPEKGKIGDSLYWQAVAMITILSDPDKVREHGQGGTTVRVEADKLSVSLGSAGNAVQSNFLGIVAPVVEDEDDPAEPEVVDETEEEDEVPSWVEPTGTDTSNGPLIW